MKAIIFSGSHNRHLYVNSSVLKYFDETLVVIMERENVLPSTPSNLSERDKKNFETHFNNRKIIEEKIYGEINIEKIFAKNEIIKIDAKKLNTIELAKRVKDFSADFCFIFGCNLILNPVLSSLPKNKINLHLGLSPWYKGSATLFWPFYFLQPQFAGVTFHQITEKPDAGNIIHQSTPKLEMGDTIHDVGAKCVIDAKNDISKLIKHFKKEGKFSESIQKTQGRVWREKDFHASHLRVIYDQFKDKIVDSYLNKELDKNLPKLFSCIDIN